MLVDRMAMIDEKKICPVARLRSPLNSKFGVPRQSGLAGSLRCRIVMESRYRDPDFLRGIEDFDYIWVIWGFSANGNAPVHSTVRPPLLGGNRHVGVFATRSPFRPNGLGLSSLRIESVERDTEEGTVINVSGADLMDGTPIYDIKPYLPYTDSHSGVRGGFTDSHKWRDLEVVIPDEMARNFDPDTLKSLTEILSLDPRPQYHDDPTRVYGMPFGGKDIRFRVAGGRLIVTEIGDIKP